MYAALTTLVAGIAVAVLLNLPAGLVMMGTAAGYAWLPESEDEDE